MAMACGSPPIAGTDGAYPEVVRDGGLLADPAHVSEWSECVAALYRSRALRARLSQQAMKLAADLTAENAARALLPLLG
jgi:glycosyltransferase involved in cell wall biosynthesis